MYTVLSFWYLTSVHYLNYFYSTLKTTICFTVNLPCDIGKALYLVQSSLVQLTSKYIHNMAIFCYTSWQCFIMLCKQRNTIVTRASFVKLNAHDNWKKDLIIVTVSLAAPWSEIISSGAWGWMLEWKLAIIKSKNNKMQGDITFYKSSLWEAECTLNNAKIIINAKS